MPQRDPYGEVINTLLNGQDNTPEPSFGINLGFKEMPIYYGAIEEFIFYFSTKKRENLITYANLKRQKILMKRKFEIFAIMLWLLLQLLVLWLASLLQLV